MHLKLKEMAVTPAYSICRRPSTSRPAVRNHHFHAKSTDIRSQPALPHSMCTGLAHLGDAEHRILSAEEQTIRLTYIDSVLHGVEGLVLVSCHGLMCVPPVGGCRREPVRIWLADRTKHGHGRFLYANVTSGVECGCSHSACSHRELQLALTVPVFSGHPWFPAKVSLHCRCPLIRGSQIYNKTWCEF